MTTDVVPEARPLQRPLLSLVGTCEVTNVDAAARELVARAADDAGGFACFSNVHVLTLALHDRGVRDALGEAWRRYPDGAAVAWLQRRAGNSEARRAGGPDVMPRVAELGRERGLRHFLLGSTPDVLARVERVLRERFPGVDIVGAHSPPFTSGDGVDGDSVAAVLASEPRPQLVWCALGAPKQELWMQRNAPRLPGIVLAGVGAAFDFLAGTKSRAPVWMQNAGLEWMHRFMSEPARLGPRYLRTNAEFIIRSGTELARRRFSP